MTSQSETTSLKDQNATGDQGTSAASTVAVKPTHKENAFDKLYTGEGGIEFIKRSKLWYSITAALVIISIAAMLIRGFSLSIDFEGGTTVSMPAGNLVAEEVEQTFSEATGVEPELAQIVGSGDSRTLEINSTRLDEEQSNKVREAIADNFRSENLSVDSIGVSNVSESWGSTITNRMIVSMLVFLVLAGIYVAIRLERQMAAAALIALIIDAVVIAGFYALFGLEVSPAVVIGLLTVLTFDIYDTVVVFDKVKENTAGVLGSRRATYGEQANLAVNQTIMRSLSTSIISALPIIALFVVAVWMLGIGTLRDLAVIQLIGVVEGLASSLFLATPLLVSIVERRPKYRKHNEEVAAYRVSGGKVAIAEPRPEDKKRTVMTARLSEGDVAGSFEDGQRGREDHGVRMPEDTQATWRPHRR